jgi:hypothetical protein
MPRLYRYRHELTVEARSERAARVLAAQAIDGSEWEGVEVGRFRLVEAKAGRFTLSLAVTLRAENIESARAMVEGLFGACEGKVEPLRGKSGP